MSTWRAKRGGVAGPSVAHTAHCTHARMCMRERSGTGHAHASTLHALRAAPAPRAGRCMPREPPPRPSPLPQAPPPRSPRPPPRPHAPTPSACCRARVGAEDHRGADVRRAAAAQRVPKVGRRLCDYHYCRSDPELMSVKNHHCPRAPNPKCVCVIRLDVPNGLLKSCSHYACLHICRNRRGRPPTVCQAQHASQHDYDSPNGLWLAQQLCDGLGAARQRSPHYSVFLLFRKAVAMVPLISSSAANDVELLTPLRQKNRIPTVRRQVMCCARLSTATVECTVGVAHLLRPPGARAFAAPCCRLPHPAASLPAIVTVPEQAAQLLSRSCGSHCRGQRQGARGWRDGSAPPSCLQPQPQPQLRIAKPILASLAASLACIALLHPPLASLSFGNSEHLKFIYASAQARGGGAGAGPEGLQGLEGGGSSGGGDDDGCGAT